jgi:hypothetical protein
MESIQASEQSEAAIETAHSLAETASPDAEGRRRVERRIDLGIIVLLSAASLLAAWAGHQAGLWSSKESKFVATAETNQVMAVRLTTTGYKSCKSISPCFWTG